MKELKFTSQLEYHETVRYGMALYVAMAILLMPVAGASIQHMALQWALPAAEETPPPEQEPEKIEVARFFVPFEGIIDQKTLARKKVRAPARIQYYHSIMRAAQTYNVDAALIRAIILAESNYNPQAVSRAGAQGLMQLMPRTARSLGVEDSFNPELNIDGGVRYFRALLDRFDGDVKLALAAYNAGSRYVHYYGGIPPFRDTRLYIQKVLKYRYKYLQEMT